MRSLKDLRGEEQTLGTLGVAYDALGNYGRAIEFHQQRLTVARLLSDASIEIQTLGSLSAACLALGDAARAGDYARQREFLMDRAGDESDLEVTIALGHGEPKRVKRPTTN